MEAESSSAMQDEVSTAIASFTRMWQNGELENSDSVAQGMLGSFLSTDLSLDTIAGRGSVSQGNLPYKF